MTEPTTEPYNALYSPPYPPDSALAVYLHIPFCRTRCSYCAFNTYTNLENLIEPYIQALQHEITLVAGQTQPMAHTIYWGGGTPSLVPVPYLEAVLKTCAAVFSLSPDLEITLEANPGTVSIDYLCALRQAGINRLSLGMQSANRDELKLFARRHQIDDVASTVEQARAAGFVNINLDLIYGIPYQTLAQWQHSLETAIRLNTPHLSLYSLTIEDATPMQRQVTNGKLSTPDPDLAADMYEWASEQLEAAGFAQYEISNWARPGFACQHNVHVWRGLPYLGLGAGAHGCAHHTRYVNVLYPTTYIERINAQSQPIPFPLSAAADEIEHLDEQGEIAETMILALRLLEEGLSLDTFRARFGRDLWEVYGPALDRLIGLGLVQYTPDRRVCLTLRARLLSNYVFREFI
ncbi:MAG: radical SAM family heme chaperone HemW [Chloroflexi bacterium]|nr:radical SAM family heme chaperone HemW [Chloroflexota bacterium]